LPALQDWCFGVGSGNGAIYQYPEKHQNKYNQLNYSFGRVTPIEAITRGGVPMKLFRAEDRR